MTPKEIKLLRRQLKLTQHELAMALGTAQNTVASWESGRRKPGSIAVRAMEMLALQVETGPEEQG